MDFSKFSKSFLGYTEDKMDPSEGSLAFYMKELSDDAYSGRGWRDQGGEKAADYIYRECIAIYKKNLFGGFVRLDSSDGLVSEMGSGRVPFPFVDQQEIDYSGCCGSTPEELERIKTPNILAFLPGNTSDFIIVSAHYDHLGKKGTQVYNGADDNASGCAALLTLLKIFSKQEKRNIGILFSFFTGEEVDFQGSKQLSKIIFENAEMEASLKGIINMDMISNAIDGKICKSCPLITVDGNGQGMKHASSLGNLRKSLVLKDRGDPFAEILPGNHSKLDDSSGWIDRSDQWSFIEGRDDLPGILLSVQQTELSDPSGDGKCYHKPCDTYEYSNPATAVKVAYVAYLLISKW